MSDLKHKLFYQSLLSASQVVFPLLTFPYITRILGPSGLGKVSYTDMLVQLFITFALFGIPGYGIREIARLRNDPVRRSQLSYELLSIHIIFSLFAALLFFITSPSLRNDEPLLFLMALTNIVVMPLLCEWYLHGMEAFRFMAVRTIIPKALAVAGIFLLVWQQEDYDLYYMLLTAAVVCTALLSITKFRKDNPWPHQSLSWKKHFRSLSYFFLTTCAFSVYIFFDTILLGKLTNDEVVGYYSTGLKISKLCLLVFLVMSEVFVPRISYLAGLQEWSRIESYLSRSLHLVITLALPIGVGLYLLAPEIVTLFAGEQYRPAIQVLQLLSPLPLFIGISNLFGIQMLIPLRKEKLLLVAALAGCIISVSLNLLLIPGWQQNGAAIANIVTELAVAILCVIFVARFLKVHTHNKVIIAAVAGCLLFSPIALAVKNYSDNVITRLLATICFSVITYFVVQWLFNNPVLTDILSFFKNKKENK